MTCRCRTPRGSSRRDSRAVSLLILGAGGLVRPVGVGRTHAFTSQLVTPRSIQLPAAVAPSLEPVAAEAAELHERCSAGKCHFLHMQIMRPDSLTCSNANPVGSVADHLLTSAI